MSNTKLLDYLIASPYNDSTDFKGNLTEEIFFEEYFIKSDVYIEKKSELDDYFSSSTEQFSPDIFLYGYSGTGKTTFIRWYLRDNCKEYNKLFFDFANIIDTKRTQNGKPIGIRIFDKYFQDKLFLLYDMNRSEINEILFIIKCNMLKINKCSFSEDFFRGLSNLYKDKNGKDIEDWSFIEFINGLDYRDLLFLILLIYLHHPNLFNEIANTKINSKAPLIIVFDNIDHIEIEHHNSDFPKNINIITHNIKQVISRLKIETNKAIVNIFCLRDANCAIINRQLADINIRKEFYFIPVLDFTEILNKRLNIALKYNVQLNEDQIHFLKYIFKSDYTKKSFLPLFNFNIRKISEFFSDLVYQTRSTFVSDIKKLSDIPQTINGARGIIYYLLIQNLLNKDYLKRQLFLEDGNLVGGEDGGHVNPARILLTNLHNLSKFNMDEFATNIHVNPVGLYSLYECYNEIFKNHDKQFFDIISDLFLFHKENWCHLITFMNKQVFSRLDFEEERKKINRIRQSKEDDIIKELNDIKLHINPSGFIYLRDIMKHYEFFSLRANNKKPLFSCTKLNYDSKKDKFIPEFIENIDKTFTLLNKCIDSLVKFTLSDIIPNFEKSVHCFRLFTLEEDNEADYVEGKPGRLYLIRIIDTHIRYIDTLRYYVINGNLYNSYYENVEDNPLFNNYKVFVNKELVKRIEKYVELLAPLKKKYENIGYNLYLKNIAENKNWGYEQWIPISSS